MAVSFGKVIPSRLLVSRDCWIPKEIVDVTPLLVVCKDGE
jgi:hypothetical protein